MYCFSRYPIPSGHASLSAMLIAVALFSMTAVAPTNVWAQETKPLPSIAEKTEGLSAQPGFASVFWDDDLGKIHLQIDELNEDLLYVVSLPAGLGSNDIGLDRGLLGSERVVRFEKVGRKLLMVAPNLRYRAQSDNAAERKAVEDAFAQSVLWAFDIEAMSDGSYLVDATDFVVRDAMDVVGRLRSSNQGSFSVDSKRSVPVPDMLKAFPENTELEARITYSSSQPGGFVRSVASNANAVTLRIRQSLIALPELDSYTPRKFDPRSGYFATSFVDYATPIGEDMTVRYVARHKLEKRYPDRAVSPPVEPIVYYLDPGTPEPVRGALLDGARWWNEAFEAAGFEEAFRVEVLPEDADPMDVRYNVINWVHRSTRGWSYGSSVSDPRTGEILKGHVSLGSLRIRQDYLIAEGLLAPYVDANIPVPEDDPMLQMALARIRQLSAHEVGHTIGLAHNFAASVNDRASVMDYPAPLADLSFDGSISLANAYDTGIGEWDKIAVRYGYSHFAPGTDEDVALEAILDEARAAGLKYITDSDARPTGGAHPYAHLWDNDENALAGLEREIDVRAVALEQFGAAAIRPRRPLANMEEALVPLYLRHRFQIEAVAKLIGGADYEYILRDPGSAGGSPVPVRGATQRQALAGLLETVSPDFLTLPESLHGMIPPRPPGYGGSRELFPGHTGLVFDEFAPAAIGASMTFDMIVQPQRAARLAYQALSDSDLPSLTEVLNTVSDNLWKSGVAAEPAQAEVQRITQTVWLESLIDLAAQSGTAPAVRAAVDAHLRETHAWLEANVASVDDATRRHRVYHENELERFLFRPYSEASERRALATPPGSPIGSVETRRAFLAETGADPWCAFSNHETALQLP